MKRFIASCLFVVVAIGILKFGQSIANADGTTIAMVHEVWTVTPYSYCKPLEACKSKLCSSQTTAECSFENTALPNAQNTTACDGFDLIFWCETRSENGLSCATKSAECGLIAHQTASGQVYYTCEATVIDLSEPGPLVKECNDFLVF
jgi:hypothetical protein